jgi:HlyD family secretion protein
MRRSSAWITSLAAVAITVGCARPDGPDAYGNVEATEVTVAAEASGRVVSLEVSEGQMLAADMEVGAVESTRTALERDQAAAQRAVAASRVDEVAQQIRILDAQREAAQAQLAVAQAQRGVLEGQIDIARRTLERTRRLADQQAATAQQLDAADRDVRTLDAQLAAQTEQINAQRRQVDVQVAQIASARVQRETAQAQVQTITAQVAQAEERLGKTTVRNPAAGTVLVKFVEPGEVVQVGQPLYRIADLRAVQVRAYVAETQLAQVRVGAPIDVAFDAGSGAQSTVRGTITWVSSQAEFTPTPIQTREERADTVYAIKAQVPNADGRLKIGMPVDVRLTRATP